MTKVFVKEMSPRDPTWATSHLYEQEVYKDCHKKKVVSISGLVLAC